MTRYIGIVGSKGGSGKTTIALNLANSLNKLKRNAVIVDGDFNSPDVGTYFNEHFEKPLNLVLKNHKDLDEAINQTEAGLHYVTLSNKLNELHDPNLLNFKSILNGFRDKFEYVIVDTPSTLSKDTIHSFDSCSELILVTEPNLMSVKEALRTKRLAEQFNKSFTGIVINKISNSKFEMGKEEIRQMLELPVLGSIENDKTIVDCMHNNILSTDYSIYINSSKQFLNVARKLIK